jgi:P27 family predicted phage terminase small subunit
VLPHKSSVQPKPSELSAQITICYREGALMSNLGPRPAPTALKLIRGTRKDRINNDEPIPQHGTVEPPRALSDEAQEVWDYAIAQLDAMRIISKADRDVLACYCEAVVTHRKATKLLDKSPVLIQGHRGVLVRNPAIAMQRDAANLIRQFAGEFGFSPSARSTIHQGATNADPSPAARYLNGA